MGKTSNTVKDRWNRQNYEEIKVRLPRGRKAELDNGITIWATGTGNFGDCSPSDL